MTKKKLLVVLGEGGHTSELLVLVDLLGNLYEYMYVISHEDNLSATRIKLKGRIYRMLRPRGKRTGCFAAGFKTLLCGAHALLILIRTRPEAVLSTGPAIFVPIAFFAKLMRIKVIFVETGSRIKSLSMTGRIIYKIADLFFVQWPQLAEKLPRAVFAGRLI